MNAVDSATYIYTHDIQYQYCDTYLSPWPWWLYYYNRPSVLLVLEGAPSDGICSNHNSYFREKTIIHPIVFCRKQAENNTGPNTCYGDFGAH